MATYVLPQVRVFQEFSVVPSAVANPLRAHISGPHAQLIRFDQTDERDLGDLGYYDRLVDTAYPWPERPAGAVVDTSYTTLWVKNALLLYFQDTISQGSTITKTAGYNNRIRSATINFVENTDTYPRAASLLDRDVRVGDVAKVRGVTGDSESVELWTYVKDIIGDTVAGEVGDAESDANNASTQSLSVSVTQTDGALNCVSASADGSNYDGLATGHITETYDILVTQSSVGRDYTTARLRVISASGEDDVASVTPSALNVATSIGTRGLTVTFTEGDTVACSASASADEVSDDDLIVGQRWQVVVNQAFTQPVPTSGGDYDNEDDTTYIVTVSRGGSYTDENLPQITVSTTNGVDISGPTNVTAAATAIDVGSHGVTIQWTGTGLRKGDRYYIDATGEFEGPMRTIELGHALSDDIPADSEVDLTLFILKPSLEIGKNRVGFAPQVNWETSETEFTVSDGIIAYDATWTDDGVPQPLDLYSEEDQEYGQLFVQTRYWLSDLCGEVLTISDVAELDDAVSGALHPDNPLKWGLLKALENSNGAEVKYTAVCDPDDETSWLDVLELLVGRDDVYGLVPLTRNRTVLDAYAAHIGNVSNPDAGLWRVLWTSLEGLPAVPVISGGSNVPGYIEASTSDGEVALGTIKDDPDTSGSQYTILRCTSGNADFLTNEVAAGDIVRTLFTTDGFGGEEYSEYVVDEVESESTLRLISGPDAPINVAAKFEIWRNLSATAESAAIGANAGAWGDRRIRATWPDRIESAGTVQEGYFLNCALAGLVSGILPHQGLTNLEITGFTDVSRTTKKFNQSQLNTMALAGTWIVTQDRLSGKVFTRHAITTGDYDNINTRLEMITRNLDSISYRFKDYFRPYIGMVNVTPTVQARLRQDANILIRLLQTEANTTDLGGQLVSGTIDSLEQHPIEKDRYVMKISCVVPYDLNNFDVFLKI